MAILSKGTTYSDGDQVTSTNLNALVDSATFASGAVDDSTTQLSSGKIIVKDLGISTGKLAASAVTTAKIAGSNVTTAKIAAANITTSLIADSNVTKAKIENLADYKVLGNVSGGAAAPAEVAILDEDNMSSNSATSLATQQSIKAYVDTQLTAEDLDFAGDSGTGSVDLDGQTFTIAGSAGLDTSASSQTLTIALDFNEISNAAIADGDFIPFVDATDSTTKKEAIADIATLFAGTGLSASSSVLSVDASQTQITSVGTLGAGAISSGFGAIDNGSSAITTTGVGSFGSLDISGDVDVDGTLETDALSIASTAVTATAAELNYNDTGASVGTVVASKTVTVDSNKDVSSFRNITLTGELDAATLDISGDADIDGTLEADAITVDGTALATVIAGTTVTNATNSAHVLVTDNESTNEENLITFVEGATSSTGNVGLEMDGNFAYNPSTGTVSATIFKGNIDAVDGDFDGTLETDALSIGGTTVTSTAAELNYLDITTLGTSEASKAVTVDSNGDLLVPDSDKFKFGTGSDMQVYHDGTNSYIENATGELKLATETSGIAIAIGHSTSETTFGDNVTITGNLTVNGTTTTVNTTNLTVTDPLVKFGEGYTGTAFDEGFIVTRGNGSASNTANKGFIWDESADEFAAIACNTEDGTTAGNVTINSYADLQVGKLTGGSLDISGDIDVDGTTNLDVVDIDGAVDMASTLTVAGEITANGTATINRLGLGVSAHASAALNITTTNQHIRFNNGSELGIIDLDSDGELNIWAHGDGEVINLRTGSGVGTDIVKVTSTGIDVVGDVTIANNNTDDTNKEGHLLARQYDSGTETEGFQVLQYFANSSLNRIDIGGAASTYNAATAITFNTAANTTTRSGSEAMRIDSSGKVGIGTDSPSSNLHVLGDSARLERTDNAFALQLYNNNASPADGAALGFLQFLGKDNNGTANIVHSEVRGGVQSNTDSAVSGYLSFLTTNNATSVTEAMRINASGDVGIGTSSPSFKLHVRSTDASDDVAYIHHDNASQSSGTLLKVRSDAGASNGYSLLDVQNNSGTALYVAGDNKVGIGTTSPTTPLQVQGDGIAIKLDGSSNTTKSIFFRQTNSSNPAQVYADGSLRLFTEDSGTDIRFHVNSDGSTNEKMRINATGVGIGTNAPGSELEVKGNGAEIFINSSDSAFSRVAHQHNGTSIWTSGTRSSDDYHIFRESGSGDVIIDNGSFLVSGTALAQADSLGVDSNGIIYSARASGSATHAIFYNGSSVVGSITTSTSATAFNTSSDYRLKENETNIIDGIDRLKQLSPYRFNFKVDPDETVDGFFAHEVSDIVPEAITGTKDGMKDEEYEVSPAVYEDVVHPAVDAVYEDVVHPATYEEVVHPAVEATYDEDGNELTPAVEEWTEQVLLTEEYTEQVLVTEAVEEWTESVLVDEAVMDTRSVPDYQGIDQAKLVPLLTAALQEAVAKIEALEARVQTLEG